ncbi:hypothetical protein PFISCL1PPCAC_28109, partial [Pristionchus fissidentatus]
NASIERLRKEAISFAFSDSIGSVISLALDLLHLIANDEKDAQSVNNAVKSLEMERQIAMNRDNEKDSQLRTIMYEFFDVLGDVMYQVGQKKEVKENHLSKPIREQMPTSVIYVPKSYPDVVEHKWIQGLQKKGVHMTSTPKTSTSSLNNGASTRYRASSDMGKSDSAFVSDLYSSHQYSRNYTSKTMGMSVDVFKENLASKQYYKHYDIDCEQTGTIGHHNNESRLHDNSNLDMDAPTKAKKKPLFKLKKLFK